MAPPESHHADGDDGQADGGQADGGRRKDLVVRLPGLASQVSRAREVITSVLGRDHPLYDDVVLLTSELATNAILHTKSGAGGSFTVTVARSETAVRVFVSDAGSEEPPCVCRASTQATSGRGLPLIEALSHRWGFTREEGSTTVWFELSQEERVPAPLAV